MIGRWWLRTDVFLHAYLVMVLGCIYFLFNFIEGISFAERAGESTLFRGAWLLLYLLLMLHVAIDRQRFGLLMLQSHLYLTFIAFALVSLALSADPAGSSIKFAMYLLTTMFSAWVVISCPVDRLVDTLFRIGIVVLIVHVLLFPVIGSQWDYDPLHRPTVLGTQAYAGVFGHKNLAGAFFGLMVLICFVRMLAGPRRQFGWTLLLMGCHFFALAAAGAAGPLISMLTALAVTFGLLLVVLGHRGAASIYWLGLAFVALVVFAVPSDELYGLVGRSGNLTGRSFLWSVWPHFFWQHPWLGYGFSGFFNELPNSPVNELTSMAPWNTEFGSFENSYLDAFLQFGLLGGALYMLLLALALWNTIVFAFERRGMYCMAPFAMLLFVVIASANDSSQLLHNYFGCVLVFWCYFGPEARLQMAPRRTFNRLRVSEA
ncbi:exopolysaccharide production protein ExoQ [Bradyrhizobium japonicum]|jgi:exopolysaccharide production protein ExoQ|uniref:O-antigen ligase family protein n=1 Tax=Bradyrhizobium TaxID=374 RepID=UPI00037B0E14|nr:MULTISPECIES: O-antigen ligase family protein [Bradyrhizobium]MCP1729874.1 O-antigen ligase [Bradyrhizobium elkanii]MCP1930329.1 O-antigen ligase [Bradyrhizobium elkanii]MCS3481412.1 O-antigen ligase [Bradyrhizobium elkanii]MCS3518257.1 O-antigen ligase [Bradyrhizobium elkanii]MCS3574003.1 O-antigen ligase [Bradyrhizobium elkanii]